MIVDTSALLAVLFKEPAVAWLTGQFRKNSSSLLMSTVNLTEALIIIRSRQEKLFDQLRTEIFGTPIRFVPPTVKHAETAAWARLKFPLNLGDCFAYALAKEEDDSLLTLDTDFGQTDIPIVIPPR